MHTGTDLRTNGSSSTHRAHRDESVEAVVRRAAERDAAADARDARARAVAEELAAHPSAHAVTRLAALAEADRAAAALDRRAAAEDREALARLAGSHGAAPTPAGEGPSVRLTTRESQVLERLARAMSTKAIAEDLYLSPNSVKTHTQSVFRKIGVSSRAEAALWARDHGFG